MGRFLIIGALAAGLFQAFIPNVLLRHCEGSPMLTIVIMIILAALLSVCSEVDAFVAAAFTRFPALSQLAFMTVGPVVDLKLAGMYFAAFKQKYATILVIAPLVTNLLIYSVWLWVTT